jgi:hypothetical protein
MVGGRDVLAPLIDQPDDAEAVPTHPVVADPKAAADVCLIGTRPFVVGDAFDHRAWWNN